MGRRARLGMIGAMLLAGCASVDMPRDTVEVRIVAINDLHGHLEPHPSGASRDDAGGGMRGGVANLAAAMAALRAESPDLIMVSAGDMIGASPLASALFLDEPTVAAMNLVGLDFNAVGNHEFDRGQAELRRMQEGGCDRHAAREPCAVEPFAGADFGFLAANVLTRDGGTFFPAYAMREVAGVAVAIIGLTLEDTPSVTAPSGIAGLRFADEAETVNALVPRLKASGADIVAVVIHQGGSVPGGVEGGGCEGLEGALVPILERLTPAVDLVVSGHTHQAYVCAFGAVDPARPFLVTSAGQYGALMTDIRLEVDPARRRVVRRSARNLPVGPGLAEAAGDERVRAVEALVARYAEAAAPLAGRTVGRLSAPATREAAASGESALGNLIADAQFAAAARAGAAPDLALMNRGGVRADLVPGPDGTVRYGQLFTVQPFGNEVMAVTLDGAALKAALERQYLDDPARRAGGLFVSSGVRYRIDRSRAEGDRVRDLTVNGAPLLPERAYRVAMSNYLANGGDRLPELATGRDPLTIGPDVDALEAYLAGAGTLPPPATDRISVD